LAFLSLLALLGAPAEQGRFKTAIMGIWIGVIAVAVLLVGAAGIAFLVDQPAHVTTGLAILGLVFGVAFGGSYPALRGAYREAELRKTIAADL
jgi:hypothetical protein